MFVFSLYSFITGMSSHSAFPWPGAIKVIVNSSSTIGYPSLLTFTSSPLVPLSFVFVLDEHAPSIITNINTMNVTAFLIDKTLPVLFFPLINRLKCTPFKFHHNSFTNLYSICHFSSISHGCYRKIKASYIRVYKVWSMCYFSSYVFIFLRLITLMLIH